MAVYANAISFVVLCGFTLLYGVVMDHNGIPLNHTCSENSSDHSANCSHRGLPSVPQNLSHDLRSLKVSHNNISMLLDKSLHIESFCGLKSLVNLGLAVNEIKSLPRGSFACAKNIEIINLSHNDIAVLDPQWFDGSYRLSTLTFYKSNIHEIKNIPWNLAIIGFQEIIENQGPEDYEYQLNLMFREDDEWWITDCMKPFLQERMPHLEHIVPNAFITLWNLRELDLTDCRIHIIDSRIFRNLTSLTVLSLRFNSIKIIPEKAFQDLHNLRTLRLNSNSISVIEKQLFSRTPSLLCLYLHDNQISKIDPFTLIPTSLKVLIIANNPFTCTCQLAWFREWLDKVNTTIYQRNETRCSSTSFKSLNNQTIWSFHPEDYCGVNIYLIVGVSLAIVTVLSLSVVVYQKRWWLNHKRFLLKLAILGYQEIIENQGPEDYEYQLNLMFREDDEWWIDDYMKPFLQERMPHLEHIVFGDSGLHPASFYLNAIYDVIDNSFKTVLLLSNQSVEDTWFMTKLRMAVEHMNDTKLEKVILIFLEDIDDDHLPYLVRLLLSRNKPYLLWVDDDEDGQELFWAKFEKSMRANREMNNVIPV
eukprot:XP_011665716.1 PREDICTED: chondroadherin-like [Strongylocentrotus purpuratus]